MKQDNSTSSWNIEKLEKKDRSICWRVNTHSLLKEMVENSNIDKSAMAIFKAPINIFIGILVEVGERASEINDRKMNALMSRLAIYETSDPYSGGYDKEINESAINEEIGIDVTELQAENDQLRRDKVELLEVLKEAHKHLEDGDIYLSQPQWERMESAITKHESK